MSKKKILILGSTGMLGHQVYYYLHSLKIYRLFDISYRNKLSSQTIILDVSDLNLLKRTISEIKPDFIINCIGVLIKGSENYKNAVYINSELPHHLKDIVKESKAKLIHISTDCVFSGKKGLYKENDPRDGIGNYAETKIMGEILTGDNLTLRTSIIGPELKSNGEGLFHWFMNQNGDVEGYNNSIWSGVTSFELAKAIGWAIETNVNGVYHITNNSIINKYELLKLFKKYTDKKINIIQFNNDKVDKSLVDTRKLLTYPIPTFDEMVASMIEKIKANKGLYCKYDI